MHWISTRILSSLFVSSNTFDFSLVWFCSSTCPKEYWSISHCRHLRKIYLPRNKNKRWNKLLFETNQPSLINVQTHISHIWPSHSQFENEITLFWFQGKVILMEHVIYDYLFSVFCVVWLTMIPSPRLEKGRKQMCLLVGFLM